MEEKASKSRKKGFMTPERKKKLRVGIKEEERIMFGYQNICII